MHEDHHIDSDAKPVEADSTGSPSNASLPRWLASVVILLAAGVACAFWLRWTANLDRDTRPLPPARVVCIDPGHPTSYSSGMRTVNGAREVDINWEVALKLEALIRREDGYRVVMTRKDRDTLMNNPERAQVANDAHSELFLRLHCDAGANHGFTLYYPDRQGEDKGVTGPSTEIIQASRRAAYALHSGMAAALNGILKDRGVRGERFTKVGRSQGALTGSIFSQVPVVTVEMVFLTSRYDARFIKSERGQWQMARALANGVAEYLHSTRRDHGE